MIDTLGIKRYQLKFAKSDFKACFIGLALLEASDEQLSSRESSSLLRESISESLSGVEALLLLLTDLPQSLEESISSSEATLTKTSIFFKKAGNKYLDLELEWHNDHTLARQSHHLKCSACRRKHSRLFSQQN